jgi:hypothetical protein
MVENDPELRRAIQRLNGRACGVAGALVMGLGLFFATNVLVLKGGENVGAHLGLLGQYFPGYRVTFLGSFIGFVYAFVLGYALGRAVGWLYDRLVADAPTA